MKVPYIWEHNGPDSLVYIESCPGAYVRGPSLEEALGKLPGELAAYARWQGQPVPDAIEPVCVMEKACDLAVRDADSDVLFAGETALLTMAEYLRLKRLALRSAADFLALYEAVPDKDRSALPPRVSFYGAVPRTAAQMYAHTKNVNAYYFAEIGVDADNDGDILACRARGFALLEQQPDFLCSAVFDGSYGEQWSLRKVLRRFVWHDRIHAKAMYRMAKRTFAGAAIPDVFCFDATEENRGC